MSYSFSFAADTKAEAKQKIADQFDTVVAGQPPHAADRDAAVACGQAFVDILTDPAEGAEVYVTMYGSLSWQHDDPKQFRSANVSMSAHLRDKAQS
jgi:hypothetical protein